MNRFTRKLLGTILGVAIVLAVRYGGDLIAEATMGPKIEELSGVWHCMEDNSYDAQDLLEIADFYEEELAVIGENPLNLVKLVEFRQDRTYRFSYDVDASKEQVRQFYAAALDDLYENRADLAEVYGDEVVVLTRDEFMQTYAEFYGMANYDALLDAFTDNAYRYDRLGEDTETGTYTIKGSDIMCTITGQDRAESLGYTLEGDNLSLIYSNDTEYYTRAN